MDYKRNLAKQHKNRKSLPKQQPKVRLAKLLPDNSSRYEEFDEDNLQSERRCEYLAEFDMKLASTPGNFFQFKHEKSFIPKIGDRREATTDKLFEIDVKALEHSLLQIPFYERCGISKDLFTEKQIERMNEEATWNQSDSEPEIALPEVVHAELQTTPVGLPTLTEEQELEEWLDDILQ